MKMLWRVIAARAPDNIPKTDRVETVATGGAGHGSDGDGGGEKSMELCCGPSPSLAVYKICPQTRNNIFPNNCVYKFAMLSHGCTGVLRTEKEMTVLINKIPKYYEYSAQHLNTLFRSAPETSFA